MLLFCCCCCRPSDGIRRYVCFHLYWISFKVKNTKEKEKTQRARYFSIASNFVAKHSLQHDDKKKLLRLENYLDIYFARHFFYFIIKIQTTATTTTTTTTTMMTIGRWEKKAWNEWSYVFPFENHNSFQRISFIFCVLFALLKLCIYTLEFFFPTIFLATVVRLWYSYCCCVVPKLFALLSMI